MSTDVPKFFTTIFLSILTAIQGVPKIEKFTLFLHSKKIFKMEKNLL